MKVTKPRRSSAQVAADKAAALAKKTEKIAQDVASRKSSLKKIADLEDAMEITEDQNNKDAARPPAGKITVSMAKRMQPASQKRGDVQIDSEETSSKTNLHPADSDTVLESSVYSEDFELDVTEESQILIHKARPQKVFRREEEEESEKSDAAAENHGTLDWFFVDRNVADFSSSPRGRLGISDNYPT